MNKILLPALVILLLCVAEILNAQVSIELSEKKSVTPADNMGFTGPKIAMTEKGPVVMWGQTGSNKTIYVAVWNETTEAFDPPVSVNGDTNPFINAQEGPEIDARNNMVYVVFSVGHDSYIVTSADAGKTFIPPVLLPVSDNTFQSLPNVAVNEEGQPVVNVMETNKTTNKAQYAVLQSDDFGETFSNPVLATTIADGEAVCECCPASMVVVEEQQFLFFRNNNENIRDIWVSRSENKGQSFDTVTDIDFTDWFIQSCPATGPNGLLNGEDIIITWMSKLDNKPSIYVNSLNRNTMEAQTAFTIDEKTESNEQNFPKIAGEGNIIGITWTSQTPQGADIYFSWSTSGIDELPVNAQVLAAGQGTQSFSDIAYSEGIFYIVYQDLNEHKVMYRTVSIQGLTATPNIETFYNKLMSAKPNPFSDFTLIEIKGKTNSSEPVQLFDIKGRKLQEWKSDTSISLDSKDLLPGIYFVKYQNEVLKLVLQ